MGSLSVHIRGRAAAAAPFPAHIDPMLATLSEMPRDESHFGFEYKWDGVRAVFFHDKERWRLETRNLKDITHGYPELAGLAAGLGRSSIVLDGEVIALDEGGQPSFGRLQHRLGLTERRALARQAEIPITYMIFDVVYLEGRSLVGMPFAERRDVLEELGLKGKNWKTPPCYRGEGRPVLEAARENRLEGIMAKRLDSPYRPGLRTRDWRKIKLVGRQEFVIGGWTPISTGAPAIGALLVGYYEPEPRRGAGARKRRLIYAGKVGTGYTERDRHELARLLEERRRDTSPFADRVLEKSVYFAEPELVGEVEFRGWTNAGHLRQPSFKGLRADKDPMDVVKEEAEK